METMCHAAIQMGINELGFSDHFDLHPNEPFPDYLDLESWWRSFETCKGRFSGELVLRAGVEVGEPHRFSHRVEQLLHDYPWDYSLGSLHWVGDVCVFDQAFFQSDAQSTYSAYLLELERMVQDSDFDILAHFDVVKRYGFEHYGPFIPHDFEPLIRRILNRLAAMGRALEINTSTMRRSIQSPSPEATILRWFFEEGGRFVTLGSDAHTPQDVGFALKAMNRMVQAEGFEGLARFDQRQVSIQNFKGEDS